MLLHLGQNVITFRTLLHLGSFNTFRPSTLVDYKNIKHCFSNFLLDFKE